MALAEVSTEQGALKIKVDGNVLVVIIYSKFHKAIRNNLSRQP